MWHLAIYSIINSVNPVDYTHSHRAIARILLSSKGHSFTLRLELRLSKLVKISILFTFHCLHFKHKEQVYKNECAHVQSHPTTYILTPPPPLFLYVKNGFKVLLIRISEKRALARSQQKIILHFIMHGHVR